jgi:hypothetical protein
MVESPAWEANSSSANTEIPRIMWNTQVHYHIHKRPPPVCILRTTIQSMPPHFLRQTNIKLLGQIKGNSVNDSDFARFQASAAV